jgi:hypothetical protein
MKDFTRNMKNILLQLYCILNISPWNFHQEYSGNIAGNVRVIMGYTGT